MAVEAHLNLFPPQITTNRDFIKSNGPNALIYNTQMGSGLPFTGTMPETLLPLHQSIVCESVPMVTASMNTDSGLTYNLPAQRKRSRDSFNQSNTFIVPQKTNLNEYPSFFGDDISFQIQQHQFEIDHIVAEHSKKIRLEIEERQKHHARLLISAIGEGIVKKMKEKDEQIQRIAKLNLVLQERVRNLCTENQLWRDLAQTNEATANSLRINLEQVLAHVSDGGGDYGGGGGRGGDKAADDAESCCDSNDFGRDRDVEVEQQQWRTLAADGGEKDGVKDKAVAVGGGGGGGGDRMCKNCGERESCVLLLPCRHLCLCTMCGSTLLLTCPVCNSNMNASVHINMS
ncbi:BOI-related E3 ubiquitin-protein ligase 1-like [Cornus florida]|uniref:BOI-related E3 ubiquitin-protein ligase 1-like n=1 Tax=Cornus florida TaxID=4283 RepID=UPI002897A0F7|nr:BOI-related E3 ubiquitin-protein ligase 1-like [Cornus florida]